MAPDEPSEQFQRLEQYRVPWQNTCWTCGLENFSFQCTDELAPLDHFIGQQRALDSLRFGLEVDKPGYNLFVTGLTGTGKTTEIASAATANMKPTRVPYTISAPPCRVVSIWVAKSEIESGGTAPNRPK